MDDLTRERHPGLTSADLYRELHPPKTRCKASGKWRYDSERAASIVLAGVRTRAALRNENRRKEQRVYKCRDCHGWHLTSKEDRHAA